MKAPLNRVTLLSLSVGAVLGFATCSVNLGDDLKYSCVNEGDCGGGGYKCAISPIGGSCCLPTGEDNQCDQKDNDCDGFVDNTGKTEACNGLDDDCDGLVDEVFDLKSDTNNCGVCKKACGPQEPCVKGMCVARKEIECFDGMDNDENGKIDCLDPSCELLQCGMGVGGCLCQALKKTEVVCNDGVDNDADSTKDCADTDCLDKECRVGCTCVAGGGQSETGCTDGIDNDQDTLVDCLDPDCVGRFCTPPQLYFSCTPSLQCKCNGSVQIAEVGTVRCRDGVDNDCNGIKDCEESTCAGISCAPDGGATCECGAGGKKEVDCTNRLDDDGDLLTDCGDIVDCPMGAPCNMIGNPDAGTCNAAKSCQ
jgi:hypothetical protein